MSHMSSQIPYYTLFYLYIFSSLSSHCSVSISPKLYMGLVNGGLINGEDSTQSL